MGNSCPSSRFVPRSLICTGVGWKLGSGGSLSIQQICSQGALCVHWWKLGWGTSVYKGRVKVREWRIAVHPADLLTRSLLYISKRPSRFNLFILHSDVVPVWLVGVWDIIWTEGCVCGSNDSTVSHHLICLPVPDAGAAECVDAQPEIMIILSAHNNCGIMYNSPTARDA